ncbi:MAG TPA: beta galactosidase jelly roll domain-containing protein, partial [Verrucomicrobiae bacterium]|nr:beta galactosidase jelly roll domain-containing protein [Verrucomicrobiae bacterium]
MDDGTALDNFTAKPMSSNHSPRAFEMLKYIALIILVTLTRPLSAENFVAPPSPHSVYSFNPGWKFIRQDVTNAEQTAFDDSAWTDVSAPHTYNDTDSYTDLISHSGGDRHPYAGIAWYRKHFKLPASAKDGKVFLEFEGLKQAGRFWVNGKFAGKYENGITPLGLDLTGFVNFG